MSKYSSTYINKIKKISNVEFYNKYKNYKREFSNCLNLIENEAKSGNKQAIYVINLFDINNLNGWNMMEYINYVIVRLKRAHFGVTYVVPNKIIINWRDKKNYE